MLTLIHPGYKYTVEIFGVARAVKENSNKIL